MSEQLYALLAEVKPPNSHLILSDYLSTAVEDLFYAKCQRFLHEEAPMHSFCMRIQRQLSDLCEYATSLEGDPAQRKNIIRQIKGLREEESFLKKKQQSLGQLCELVDLKGIREVVDSQGPKDPITYLQTVNQLYKIYSRVRTLTTDSAPHSLIQDMKSEVERLLSKAIENAFKKHMSQKMLELMAQEQYKSTFEDNSFKQIGDSFLVPNRELYYRMALNPMLNNLNYANNLVELIVEIAKQQGSLIETDIGYFRAGKRDFTPLIKAAVTVTKQTFGRLSKHVFKLKTLIDLGRVRKTIEDFLQHRKVDTASQTSFQWEPLPSLLNEIDLSLEMLLKEQSETLCSAKYNIQSLTSYLPVREHLAKIHWCIEQGINSKIDWEAPIKALIESRKPPPQTQNKSLVMFSINVWQLYFSKLSGLGKYCLESQELIERYIGQFVRMNLETTAKAYPPTFDKLLILNSNIPALKAVLHAELALLTHEEIRGRIVRNINRRFKTMYEEMLVKLEKQPMGNIQLKKYCQQHKINLNKFGKHSEEISILSSEELMMKLDEGWTESQTPMHKK